MSKILYCIAQFTPRPGKFESLFQTLKALEPDTLREEGCLSYRVTKHIHNAYAPGKSMPIVFHESWASVEDFERHCQRKEIVAFFEKECLSEEGMVEDYNVAAYMDE
ncbi:MAG TPA: antibiotic biosynthesis monooxygenase [Epsilonproteobacteria bacterium]|nr:antibiotic biosynthesis monooxygenase [Campylobacterota bacterium]